MNTLNFPAFRSISMPGGVGLRTAKVPHLPLWWVGGIAISGLVVTVALIAGTLLTSEEVVAVELRPAVIDPFLQQKLDAKHEDLPAQF